MKSRRKQPRRAGNILVLTACMMIVMIGMLAFAVDIGYVTLVRTQLQASADAAALAATWKLLDLCAPESTSTTSTTLAVARSDAGRFAGLNSVSGTAPALSSDDVVFGRIDVTAGQTAPLITANVTAYNATNVQVRRQGSSNGEIPLFFARALGMATCPSQAQATAAFADNFSGFRTPAEGTPNLGILPFALDKQTWERRNSEGADSWTWSEQTGQVTSGGDGIREMNLYPEGTGDLPPGNRGTVDIGSNNNSTADIARQIREGLSAADLAHLGGSLQFGPDGTLILNGDTGISAGVKDDLASIIGQPRLIPLFSSVTGPGNNAQYTIVGFAGVRIVEVNLTGKVTSKRVIVQPARVEVHGGIPATDGVQHTFFIHSPVWLVR
jgi:hypothetical protein